MPSLLKLIIAVRIVLIVMLIFITGMFIIAVNYDEWGLVLALGVVHVSGCVLVYEGSRLIKLMKDMENRSGS